MRRDLPAYLSAAGFALVATAAAITSQFGPIAPPNARAEIQRINEAIDTLPYIRGSLVGDDTPPMPSAIQMLRPERLIQRSFIDTDSTDRFNIVIVFSPDARDLAGHHPPVCYPNAGWTLVDADPSTVRAGDRDIAATSYRFERHGSPDHQPVRVVATSFFVVPGNADPFQSQMGAVEAAARDRRAAGLGAVHVMVTFDDPAQPEDRDRLLSRAGEVLSSMIDRISP